MTTLADLETQVRDGLGDYPRFRRDTGNGDGVMSVFDLGKDVGVQTLTEAVTIGGVAKVRNVDYWMGPAVGVTDYGASQVAFVAPPPVGANNIVVAYRECAYRSEKIWSAINDGRKMLWRRFYKRGVATITIRNNVRDYDLATADVNEPAMRAIFAGNAGGQPVGGGSGTYFILNARIQSLASPDQARVPFRRFSQEGETGIHLFDLPGQGSTLRLEFVYAFTPLFLPTDQTDIPDYLQSLIVLWAISTLALKTEPARGRIDTAAVMQSNNANPPGTMAQTSDDFISKWTLMRNAIPGQSFTFEPRDIPASWETGLVR